MNIASCVSDYRAAGKTKEDLLSLMHAQVDNGYAQGTMSEEDAEDQEGKEDTPRMSGRKNMTGKYSSKKRAAVSIPSDRGMILLF